MSSQVRSHSRWESEVVLLCASYKIEVTKMTKQKRFYFHRHFHSALFRFPQVLHYDLHIASCSTIPSLIQLFLTLPFKSIHTSLALSIHSSQLLTCFRIFADAQPGQKLEFHNGWWEDGKLIVEDRFSDLGVYPMYYNLVEEESDAEELQGSSGSDE
eukprot:jgi/Botrbrau1/4566/Bobra.60_2s0053.1